MSALRTIPSIFVLFAATGARAQVPDSSTAFQVEIFEPQPAQGLNLLTLMKSDVMQHLYPSVGVFGHYVDDPFELARQSDEDVVISRVVARQLKLEPWLVLGLFDIVDIGIVMPLVALQDGDPLDYFNRGEDEIDGFTVGDLRVIPKVRIIRPEDAAGFGLAFAAQMYLPTGDADTFNSYGSARFKPTLAVDWRDARNRFAVAANIGYTFQPKTTAHNLVLDDSLHWGFGVDVGLAGESARAMLTLHGVVALTENRDASDLRKKLDDSFTSPIETDLALQFRVDTFVMQLGGGLGITNGVGAPDFRAFASFAYTPVVVDRDEDRVEDGDDDCPSVPEDDDGFEDDDGCPDRDNDNDGVLDVSDGPDGDCKDDPEDKDGWQDEDGCTDLDNDGDGLADKVDGKPDGSGFGRCRDSHEDKDGFEDDDGCLDADDDKDGIPDVRDGPLEANGLNKCRLDPEDKDGFEDEDGCSERDNDNDGVPDLYDGEKDASGYGVCRNEPETKNGIDDQDGCPDAVSLRVKVTQFQIVLHEKIAFDGQSPTILPASHGLLDELARVMNANPMFTRIRIESHTDDQGANDANLWLSQGRADAIMAYLHEHGISNTRLEAVGYGETRPLVTGAASKTEAGREKNRRIEFHIIEVKGRPHSPEKPVLNEKNEVIP